MGGKTSPPIPYSTVFAVLPGQLQVYGDVAQPIVVR